MRFLLVIFLFVRITFAQHTDVLIVGAGASGTMAAIQAARSGVKVMLIEETPWPGGMLTSTGVSAIDGNYKLPSGLWHEFRLALEKHYGGADSLKTGWVSNVLFEPQVATKILTKMLKEAGVEVHLNTTVKSLKKLDNGWRVKTDSNVWIETKILIDASELGDILAKAKIPYDIGMDSRYVTGEEIAPEQANDIIQDLTYVAILKDYGEGANKTIEKPKHFDPKPFLCTCEGQCDPDTISRTLWPCEQMLNYGKLPNGYYMINWPIYGNDYYLNLIEANPKRREKMMNKAKNFTLSYVYYLQHYLGFSHLGLADDVYPTRDQLPFIPYHRESRRMHGKVRFDLNDLAKPFEQPDALYRTGIAVGDYPVDHHHAAYPNAKELPDLHFYPVPSYSLPLGTLIPEKAKNFIVAEKSISVTNLVNGTTRLQPVCMLLGQAAGALAALSVRQNKSPDEIEVRDVQDELLKAKAYLMPYRDVRPDHPYFEAIQRIGATGILRSKGETIGWENVTRFFPDSTVNVLELTNNLKDFNIELTSDNKELTLKEAQEIALKLKGKSRELLLTNSAAESKITRAEFAYLLDQMADPFHQFQVDLQGFLISE
ncbi:FAD-dependent oxidoreductase [Jiulongibacter sediminis]|uniref:FAD-dependent oxidoreductase n=1 Tax=Jiulongibacter sediminis TaxID=1605367 RepID=UPI0026ECD4A1|nr:FAD-dependent oxidoreductase [Jiulongibacter sediminis]